MKCTTVRKDENCVFMKAKGCSFEGGVCKPIVEKCEGCDRIVDLTTGKYCSSFPEPTAKWRMSLCNMATHQKIEVKETKQKLNPLKASKRGNH